MARTGRPRVGKGNGKKQERKFKVQDTARSNSMARFWERQLDYYAPKGSAPDRPCSRNDVNILNGA